MPSVSLPTVLCSNADPDQLPQACSSLHPVDGRPLSLPAARPPPPPPFHPLLTSVPSALPPCIWGQQRELSQGQDPFLRNAASEPLAFRGPCERWQISVPFNAAFKKAES